MSATVLFDSPGPKARARYRAMSVVGALIILGIMWVVIAKFSERGQLTADKWQPFLEPSTWVDYLVPGIINTLKAAAISIVLASVFGLVFGVGRLSQNAAIRWISSVIVEFFRAVPVLLMMVFAFFTYVQTGLVPSTQAPLAGVVTGLTLYNGAVLAELVRSGVQGLPGGQREAGVSIGLSEGQTLRLVLLPQALTAMLPALIGQLVVVVKDTALGYQILYTELLTQAKTLGSARGNTIPAYIVAAIIFIAVNFTLTWLANRLQTRMSRSGVTTEGTGAPQRAAVATAPHKGLNAEDTTESSVNLPPAKTD
ncbi:MAG: amino acid ABC transporter permease [Nostocoides sp.]